MKLLLLMLFSIFLVSDAAVRRIKQSGTLYLDPVVKAKYPNAAIVELDFLDLEDVHITNLQDGQCISYDASMQKWENTVCTSDTAITHAGDRALLDGAVQVRSIQLSDFDIDFCSDGGTCRSISIPETTKSRSYTAVQNILEAGANITLTPNPSQNTVEISSSTGAIDFGAALANTSADIKLPVQQTQAATEDMGFTSGPLTVTFARSGSTYAYNENSGTPQPLDRKLISIVQADSDPDRWTFGFSREFLIENTPASITIDGTSYNFTVVGSYYYAVDLIHPDHRVSGTDLDKTIQIKYFDNLSFTFPGTVGNINRKGIAKSFASGAIRLIAYGGLPNVPQQGSRYEAIPPGCELTYAGFNFRAPGSDIHDTIRTDADCEVFQNFTPLEPGRWIIIGRSSNFRNAFLNINGIVSPATLGEESWIAEIPRTRYVFTNSAYSFYSMAIGLALQVAPINHETLLPQTVNVCKDGSCEYGTEKDFFGTYASPGQEASVSLKTLDRDTARAWLGVGSGGGMTTVSSTQIGPSQTAVFQVPATAQQTLTNTAANTPVFYNIPSITGTGISGILTQSAVSGVARVTAGAAGYVNLSWEDEINLESSTAGGAGQDGEFVFAITQYGSGGGTLRSWVYEHGISDPITHGHVFPFSLSTGLTPVSQGDYFTFNFAFSASQANKNARFSLPSDNAGLDERIEFFYFPRTSLGQGPAGPAGPAGASTFRALTDTPATYTANQYVKVNAAGDALEFGTVQSGGLSAVSSDSTLRGTGTSSSPLSVTNPVKSSHTIRDFQNFAVFGTPVQQRAVAALYDPNDMFFSYGFPYLVTRNTGYGHGIKAKTAQDTNGNRGFSLTGSSTYGSEVRTIDGSTDLTAATSPVDRIEFQSDNDIEVLINKSAVSATDIARSTIYMRIYTAAPSALSDVATITLTKGTDYTDPDGVVYLNYGASGGSGVYNDFQTYRTSATDNVLYFNFFTAQTPDTNAGQNQNPLDFFNEKNLLFVGYWAAPWASSGASAPVTTSYEADEATTTKSLKVAVQEITPAMEGTTMNQDSDITFLQLQNGLFTYTSPTANIAFGGSQGSSSIANTNLIQLYDQSSFHATKDNYVARFLNTLVKQKTPIKIEIDGSSYNLNFSAFHTVSGGYTEYESVTIPSNDRVSATDLTKAINFELVNNEQITLTRFVSGGPSFSPFYSYRTTISFNNITKIGYVGGSSNSDTCTADVGGEKWCFDYSGSKTPSEIIINGRSYTGVRSEGGGTNTYSIEITDANFIPSATNLSFGFNVKFSDGTYANNTITHLFQTTTEPTPEVKVQKVLTKSGVIDWLTSGINALIAPWARNPGTGYMDARRFCQEMTDAAYTALSTKNANQFYCIPSTQ